jgi:hypothetical protein
LTLNGLDILMSKQIATKNLNTQNATAELFLPEDWNGAVALFVSGTGTILLEIGSPRISESGSAQVPSTRVNEWLQLKLFNPIVGVNAAVDSLIAAAAQLYAYANCVGVDRVRARRTDAGNQDCFVSIMWGRSGV